MACVEPDVVRGAFARAGRDPDRRSSCRDDPGRLGDAALHGPGRLLRCAPSRALRSVLDRLIGQGRHAPGAVGLAQPDLAEPRQLQPKDFVQRQQFCFGSCRQRSPCAPRPGVGRPSRRSTSRPSQEGPQHVDPVGLRPVSTRDSRDDEPGTHPGSSLTQPRRAHPHCRPHRLQCKTTRARPAGESRVGVDAPLPSRSGAVERDSGEWALKRELSRCGSGALRSRSLPPTGHVQVVVEQLPADLPRRCCGRWRSGPRRHRSGRASAGELGASAHLDHRRHCQSVRRATPGGEHVEVHARSQLQRAADEVAGRGGAEQ